MESICNSGSLQQFLTIEIELIERHIDKHKWFNHIADRDAAIADFIEKYGWLIRDCYCSYTCPNRNQCQIKNNI